MKRRDRIGQLYLPRVNPIVEPALDREGTLHFGNAAVDHAVATAPTAYRATWFVFDNATGVSREIGATSSASARIMAPTGMPQAAGAYVRIDLRADHPEHPAWRRPIETYFRRDASGWKLVGLVRQP